MESRFRSVRAGEDLGRAIIEMVHLMYQRDTAIRFLKGLKAIIDKELDRRLKELPKYRKRRNQS